MIEASEFYCIQGKLSHLQYHNKNINACHFSPQGGDPISPHHLPCGRIDVQQYASSASSSALRQSWAVNHSECLEKADAFV
jgi:hypothetical protein